MNHRVPPISTSRSRALRSNATDAERKLWSCLRACQLGGYRFRRQHPVESYIADFACIEAKLIVEVDGGQHQAHEPYDIARTKALQEQGWRVLRFWNNDVLRETDAVVALVASELSAHPHPSLPPQRGKEHSGGVQA